MRQREEAAVAAAFLGLAPATRSFCRDLRWFGTAGSDGGYDVCLDNLHPGNCVVYSVGTRDNPSFDIAMGRYGCEVHSFDPTLDQQGLSKVVQQLGLAANNVTFHDVGIGGRDFTAARGTAPWQWPGLGYGRSSNSKVWTLRTLESLMHQLGHKRIDVFKMDAEGAEWPVLEHLLSGEWARERLAAGSIIRQLILEVHLLPRPDPSRPGGWQKWASPQRASSPSPAGWLTRLGITGQREPPQATRSDAEAPYPIPSASDADAFNWHAADLLQQLVHVGGFALHSHRVNGGGPYFDVSARRTGGAGTHERHVEKTLSCCHELSFVWRGPNVTAR